MSESNGHRYWNVLVWDRGQVDWHSGGPFSTLAEAQACLDSWDRVTGADSHRCFAIAVCQVDLERSRARRRKGVDDPTWDEACGYIEQALHELEFLRRTSVPAHARRERSEPWSEFLRARARLLPWLRDVCGESPEQSCQTLRMDPLQVRLILDHADQTADPCEAKDSAGVRCELPLGHAGGHACPKALNDHASKKDGGRLVTYDQVSAYPSDVDVKEALASKSRLVKRLAKEESTIDRLRANSAYGRPVRPVCYTLPRTEIPSGTKKNVFLRPARTDAFRPHALKFYDDSNLALTILDVRVGNVSAFPHPYQGEGLAASLLHEPAPQDPPPEDEPPYRDQLHALLFHWFFEHDERIRKIVAEQANVVASDLVPEDSPYSANGRALAERDEAERREVVAKAKLREVDAVRDARDRATSLLNEGLWEGLVTWWRRLQPDPLAKPPAIRFHTVQRDQLITLVLENRTESSIVLQAALWGEGTADE